MQPNQAQLPEVSILDKCSNQIRAAYHSVDQQLEPCLTEVNRLLSHHPDNPAPSLSSSSFKDPSKPCRSAAAEVGKTREQEFLHPTAYNRIDWFLLPPAQTCLIHHTRKDIEIWRWLPPKLLICSNKLTELRTLFFSCEEACRVLWWRMVLICFTERGVRACIRWSGGHEHRNSMYI